MRRADRLFQLVQLIRGRRLTTAQWLAERLQVTVRTVYRDIAALQYQGVPIEGEAGVGYRFGKGFDLPPLQFTREEAQALVAAARIARQWLDPALGQASDMALSRIVSVLPTEAREAAQALPVYAPSAHLPAKALDHLQQLRQAQQSLRKVSLHYLGPDERRSVRTVRPLACLYWGSVWTLVAWCELRDAFRSFRIDRIEALTVSELCAYEAGKTLADFMRQEGLTLAHLGA